MNVVDSSVWLAYFADEPTADFFVQAIEDTDLLIVPSVCIDKVFKVILREKGEDQAFWPLRLCNKVKCLILMLIWQSMRRQLVMKRN